jgi:glutathione S-transferase
MKKLTLVSHTLCPYVQRAAIVLAEKGAAFERRYIDLSNKPEWFTAISPLGKTPVLLVDDDPVFESAVICDYLDETLLPRLHPEDPLSRARHRGWIEFASSVLAAIGAFYNAPDDASLQLRREDLVRRFARLEEVLPQEGPYFAGLAFSVVDAAFAPVFRYFDVLEPAGERGFFKHTPKVRAWRAALCTRPSVQQAVRSDYPQELMRFFLARNSALSRRLAATASEALTTGETATAS